MTFTFNILFKTKVQSWASSQTESNFLRNVRFKYSNLKKAGREEAEQNDYLLIHHVFSLLENEIPDHHSP